VAVTALYMHLGSIIKTGVETLGPQITKCDVTVEDIQVAPLGGRVEIIGMVVGNPEGFKTPSAFKLDHIRIRLDSKSLLGDRIHIQEILIDSPEITYEVGLSGSNIGAIQKNVEAYTGGAAEAAPSEEGAPVADAPGSEGSGKDVQLDDFRLTGAKLNLSAKVMAGEAVSVELPEIHLQDLGTGDGRSVAEIVSEVFGAVFKEIGEAATGAGAILEDGKKLVKEVGEEAKKAGEAVKESASKALGGVKGLFKRK